MVSSTLCLFCLSLLFSMFSPPLRVHCSLSVLIAWTLLNSDSNSTLTNLTVSVHGFSHLIPMLVRFLFHLPTHLLQLRLEFPMFDVIMNAQGVAGLSSSKWRQHASSICFFSYVVDAFFLHCGGQTDSKSI